MSEQDQRRSEFRLMLGVEAVLIVAWLGAIGVDALHGISFGDSESGEGHESLFRGMLAVLTICLVPAAFEILAASDAKPEAAPKPQQQKRRIKRTLGPAPKLMPPRPRELPVKYLPGRYSHVPGLFVADECVSRELIEQVRRLGMTVVTCDEAGLRRAKDIAYLEAATRRRWIVVTHDGDFEALHDRGVAHAGIVHARFEKVWQQEILRLMLTLSEKVKV